MQQTAPKRTVYPQQMTSHLSNVGVFDEFRKIEKGDFARARVLLVDDELINLELLKHQLASNFCVATAKSGMEAIEHCLYDPPDLVVMDVNMPNINGLQACEILRDNELTREIPVLFLTSQDSQEDEQRCWQAGGSDFISKPANTSTLVNRIKVHLTLKLKADLLRSLVFKDPLTVVYNRRYFDELLPQLFAAAVRGEQPLSLLLIDFDHFKNFNTVYGHDVGDECLRLVAKVIDGCLKRPSDVVARLNGDRFACVLQSTDATGAIQLSNSIIEQIHGLSTRLPIDKATSISVSIGIGSTTKGDPIRAERELLAAAENKLHQSKQAGRDCYSV